MIVLAAVRLAINTNANSLVELAMTFAAARSKYLPNKGSIRSYFDKLVTCRSKRISVG